MSRRAIVKVAAGLKGALFVLVPLLIGAAVGVYLGSTYMLRDGMVVEKGPQVANSYPVDVLGVVESVSSSQISIKSCEYSTKGETAVYFLDRGWTKFETDPVVGQHVYITYIAPDSGEPHTVYGIYDAEPYLRLPDGQ